MVHDLHTREIYYDSQTRVKVDERKYNIPSFPEKRDIVIYIFYVKDKVSDSTGVAGAIKTDGSTEVLGVPPIPCTPGYTVDDLVVELDEIPR
eukprot:10147063-Prorocentrum_lima.AAC.1